MVFGATAEARGAYGSFWVEPRLYAAGGQPETRLDVGGRVRAPLGRTTAIGLVRYSATSDGLSRWAWPTLTASSDGGHRLRAFSLSSDGDDATVVAPEAVSGSIEIDTLLSSRLIHLSGVVFGDVVVTEPSSLSHSTFADLGIGLRFGIPFVPGRVSVDWSHEIDGRASAFGFRWESVGERGQARVDHLAALP